MDSDYFRQITLPFRRKVELIHSLMRFIVAQPSAVPRDDAFFKRFIAESNDVFPSKEQAAAEPWLMEHIARLFWACCEMRLLKYQYPYPHHGQTYLPTRAGRILARAPQIIVSYFVAINYIASITAGPVKNFKRVRSIVTVLTGLLLWWRQNELSPLIVAVSLVAGIVATWIASFFSNSSDSE